MSYNKLWIGLGPSHERMPTIEADGRDKVFLIGSTWKEQVLRAFPPPFVECVVMLSPSSDPPGFEVVATFPDDVEQALAWSWDIETSLPTNWDEVALNRLVKANWLSDITRRNS